MANLVLVPRAEESREIIERVTPAKSAAFLHGLVEEEAVQRFSGQRDLETRMNHGLRRIYALRDAENPDRAHVSVQIALASGLPSNIQKVVAANNPIPGKIETAVFYSISNWKDGKPGMGRPLIHGVGGLFITEQPHIRRFATLSPIPTFRARVESLTADEYRHIEGRWLTIPFAEFRRKALGASSTKDLYERPDILSGLQRLAVMHTLQQRGKKGDGVGRFHTSNGAIVGRLCVDGDTSAKGFEKSFGMMMNYIYPVDPAAANPLWRIQANMEGFRHGHVPRTQAVQDVLMGRPTKPTRPDFVNFWHTSDSKLAA